MPVSVSWNTLVQHEVAQRQFASQYGCSTAPRESVLGRHWNLIPIRITAGIWKTSLTHHILPWRHTHKSPSRTGSMSLWQFVLIRHVATECAALSVLATDLQRLTTCPYNRSSIRMCLYSCKYKAPRVRLHGVKRLHAGYATTRHLDRHHGDC